MQPHRFKRFLFVVLFMVAPLGAAQEDSASLAALRSAAEQGQADAQYELGILYEFGYNFPDHLASAYGWYSRAADQGNAAAVQRRDILKAQLSPSDVEKAHARSRTTAPSTSR
jgi:TPR repeat protein